MGQDVSATKGHQRPQEQFHRLQLPNAKIEQIIKKNTPNLVRPPSRTKEITKKKESIKQL